MLLTLTLFCNLLLPLAHANEDVISLLTEDQEALIHQLTQMRPKTNQLVRQFEDQRFFEEDYNRYAYPNKRYFKVAKNSKILDLRDKRYYRLAQDMVLGFNSDEDFAEVRYIADQRGKKIFQVQSQDLIEVDSIIDLNHKPEQFEQQTPDTVNTVDKTYQISIVGKGQYEVFDSQVLANLVDRDLDHHTSYRFVLETFYRGSLPLDVGVFASIRNISLTSQAGENFDWETLGIGPSLRYPLSELGRIKLMAQLSGEYNLKSDLQSPSSFETKLDHYSIEFSLEALYPTRLGTLLFGVSLARHWLSVEKSAPRTFLVRNNSMTAFSLFLGYQLARQR